MSTRLTANHTIIACFIGYIVQAVVNNFAPLLFLTFQSDYGVPLGQIAMLTAINFTVQLVTDAVSPAVIKRVGYRAAAVTAAPHRSRAASRAPSTSPPGRWRPRYRRASPQSISAMGAEDAGEVVHDFGGHVGLVHGVHMDPTDPVGHQVHHLLGGVDDTRLLHGVGPLPELI